jgi:3-hydroxyisobutyrate dehydrogenase
MMNIGFLGLGTMGLPMAVNIARTGLNMMVYNRTGGKAGPALEAGGAENESLTGIFEWADTLIMMLSGPVAIDCVLEPVLQKQSGTLKGKVLVNMGTTPPAFTQKLVALLAKAGAVFVDAPVSGTQVQAEEGTLLVMTSGPDEVVSRLSPIFNAVGNKVFNCGAAPQATMMKLAVNIVLSASIAGLVEGANFARKADLNVETFFKLLLSSPLRNDIFAIKAKKIIEEDFTPQASIGTVREMLKHITDAAHDIHAFIPGTLTCVSLISAAVNQGAFPRRRVCNLKGF